VRELDIELLRLDANGLIPVIAQDANSNKVLMLGYSNRECLAESLDIGKLVFYSRSRGERWLKGETSGNFLQLVGLYADCDQDAVLALVEPDGPTCHNGTASCFEEPRGSN